ncbi:hypothetical protein ABH926_009827 [Catenulispora sp. GP43]|uniref:hypothetical protein n=1 Tax=Catenulispora sp. GP43 TaxID=3156263 RepID=UPI0035156F5B
MAESLRAQSARWAMTIAGALLAVVSACLIPGLQGRQHAADFFDADHADHADHADQLSVTATVTGVSGSTSGKFRDTRVAVTADDERDREYAERDRPQVGQGGGVPRGRPRPGLHGGASGWSFAAASSRVIAAGFHSMSYLTQDARQA